MKEDEKWLSLIQNKAIKDPRVKGMMIYGSSLHSPNFRDIDIALFLSPDLSSSQSFQLRLDFLKEVPDYFDIKIFNLLPVSIQQEVLKGKVIFTEEMMYDLVYQSIQEYEDFIQYQDQYKEAYLRAN
ncbi:MAG: nucleotidyltransferase domain-containing protein [Promethearchaeota archaeon]